MTNLQNGRTALNLDTFVKYGTSLSRCLHLRRKNLSSTPPFSPNYANDSYIKAAPPATKHQQAASYTLSQRKIHTKGPLNTSPPGPPS